MSFKPVRLYPCNPTTARGVSTKLSASKGKIIYTNGKTVIIRDLNDPAIATAYAGHTQNATVARLSPSGYYCASGDVSGTVRVWDIVGEENSLKGEYKVISGRINDLDWDGESKRIIAVGDGREKFGHAFMMDTGSSTGEIIGHSKVVNAVAIRQQRPYRAVTASDDTQIIFHQGPPYKFDKTIKTHTKFVQDVKYSPSGEHFVSVGSDAKIFLYDGKTGDMLGELDDSGHKGSIMACSWSLDNKSVVTSSMDCTVKLWDVESRKSTASWTVGTGVNHQQVGNVWAVPDSLVSLSMTGDLNVFDPRVGDKPARIIRGATKAITSALSTSSDTFLTGTAEGRLVQFSVANGEASYIAGDGHTNLVTGLSSTPDGKVVSVGFDDKLREIEQNSFTPAALSLSSQPKAVAAAADGTVFVAEVNSVEAIRSNQKVSEISTKFVPSTVAAHNTLVAVGGEDQKVHLHEWDGKTLKELTTLDGNKGTVSAIAFSPDGAFLAAGDSSGKVILFKVDERKVVTSRWSFHSARINSLSWTADSQHCASGSLDTHVYVWSVQKPLRNIAIKNAGPGGVNTVVWLESDGHVGKLVSAGADACARLWEVTFHS
ncbi:WD40 repeat-like protein [Gloeophyllum trabeum ATCC 11539]|uniref:WD40 repeat-like protein n=1 Tax=Gloeophyllum trabeum (strain ATCC 11539 / FP-39264 / Madison 617) TaxID=670483 RepID=S7PXX9_GLOTA|nr:WD40 repeat-like protein [Gloeophyllum trabeum ATCC 11539]EPQ52202.1 WD40 repeat-like protein [Gloeophyllum trabeum ATCC 11539]